MKYLSATTEFSLGQSLLSTDDIINLVKKNDIDKAFICDTMNVSAMIPLYDKLGDKVAFGVRFNLVDELLDEKKLPVYQPKVFPLSIEGMELIYKYLSLSYEKPYFYYTARLDIKTFYQMLEEGENCFAVTTGDFFNLLTHPKYKEVCEEIKRRTDYFYPEVVDIGNAKFAKTNKLALNIAYLGEEIEFRPTLYLEGDDSAFPIHYSINKNVEFNYLKPWNKDLHYEPTVATDRTKVFANLHFYTWKKQDPKLPILAVNPNATLKAEVLKGFKERFENEVYGYKPETQKLKDEYVPRLKYELETIERLGFASYFLMVFEVTSWCQRQGILMGPGRGSAAGSLIAYCLKITDVDPIRGDLMFERFINPSRIDLPDIDLDFMSTRREEIISHLYDRYGRENVASIVNYATLQGRSALRSTCRILGMEDTEYACSKLIPSNFGVSATLEEAKAKVIDINQFALKHPEPWNIANKLEKKLRNFSTHAAGIIVSDRPLIKDAVIEQRKGSRVINWDKKICEKQGLIKLDVLGLTTLDIIDLALKFIRERHHHNVVLNEIRLDNKTVLDSFARGSTGGIFQFEGGSARRLLRDLSTTVDLTFDDLIAANALNRPGPIEAGLVKQYVDGKNGNPIEPWHPSIAKIVEPTFNVPGFQEQIMQIAVDLAGYTLPEADNLRKIMGKKLPEEMKKEAGKFIDGCTSMGVDKSVAIEIFKKIEGFAHYAFNKSHSFCYSLLAYQCMYLKVYYPVEFYAASLTFVDDSKVRSIINEAGKFGIKVLPPEINSSTDKFEPKDSTTIVAPLTKIKYLSGAASKEIIRARADGPFKDYDDLVERTATRYVNSRVLEGLTAVGALDDLVGVDPATIDPVARSRAINEYLPSIPLGFVTINRKMKIDKSELSAFLHSLRSKNPNAVIPFVGSTPKFMVVFDQASKVEQDQKQFTLCKAFMRSCQISAYRSGIDKADVYWTGLIKREKAKGEKTFSNETLDEAYKELTKEIDIVRPPIVLALGSTVARFFAPSLKGAIIDHCGSVFYNKEKDMNVIIGFNPGMIHFNSEYETKLDELFEMISEML